MQSDFRSRKYDRRIAKESEQCADAFMRFHLLQRISSFFFLLLSERWRRSPIQFINHCFPLYYKKTPPIHIYTTCVVTHLWCTGSMGKTAYINARMEKKLKADAEKVFREVGVSPSDALTMFYRQAVIQQGIPFEVRIPNKETRKAIAELEAGKGKVYTGSTKEVFDSIIKKR